MESALGEDRNSHENWVKNLGFTPIPEWMLDASPPCVSGPGPAMGSPVDVDGFWELDLKDGSAWFSDWFKAKLKWPTTGKRRTLAALQPLLKPDAWRDLLVDIRTHLENKADLDRELAVRLLNGDEERWQFRGWAHRDPTGHPTHLIGSVRDLNPNKMIHETVHEQHRRKPHRARRALRSGMSRAAANPPLPG